MAGLREGKETGADHLVERDRLRHDRRDLHSVRPGRRAHRSGGPHRRGHRLDRRPLGVIVINGFFIKIDPKITLFTLHRLSRAICDRRRRGGIRLFHVMTVAHVYTVAFQGIEAREVDVQVHIGEGGGTGVFNIVGLADKAVAKARSACAPRFRPSDWRCPISASR